MLKLLKLSVLKDGVIRLQSQLYVGKNVADYILENGILKVWKNGESGFGFYETDTPYEITESVKEMTSQQL